MQKNNTQRSGKCANFRLNAVQKYNTGTCVFLGRGMFTFAGKISRKIPIQLKKCLYMTLKCNECTKNHTMFLKKQISTIRIS
jgi:hypothetical protein